MIRKSLVAIAASLWGCAEPPPPPAERDIIERAVKHAQDQVDGGRRSRGRGAAALVESGA